MTLSHRAQLEQIRTFPQLIRFLRDEMAWPIESEDFEDLTFTYTLEELGIASDSAAKSAEIQRLRPLVVNQPWGIFFVKFEPKRLPVVALRRILSAFVMRKRASANSADRMTWETDDLLFISSYGEDEERQLSFAHFSPSVEGSSLPTLKVLGWDNRDTALHLDAVAETLTQRLAWPANGADAEHWRESWRSAFTLRHREVITTSREMSIRLAELARAIRDRINTALAIETDRGPLTKLMKAFRESLVHDLTPDGFADMYAQTIAYGLLSARIADPKLKTTGDLGAHMRTNPLLRDLMKTFLDVGDTRNVSPGHGLDFDELSVNEVVELLDDANMDAVLRDFGDRNPQEDPVIHFYELFLREYDAKKRMQRGVFYTPRPVVSFIVRSVHELLRTEFGLEDGLADTATWAEVAARGGVGIPEGVSPDQPFVQILDPATGTGTFLVEVIEVVHKTMTGKWKTQGLDDQAVLTQWNDYVAEHLLPRLHGFELLMAPYAIAHLKVGLKLYETGYGFRGEERVRVYLTNALEPAPESHGQMTLEGFLPALAHEAAAVGEVKRHQRFTIVLGNPPYAGHSLNNQVGWVVNKVYDYKRAYPDLQKPGQAKWLQDDYVKFLRFAEWEIERSGHGIVGFITNHAWLENPTFKGMRRHLLDTFRRLAVLDLHGNANRKEVAPDGSPDNNVFDIKQGVAVSLLRLPPTDDRASEELVDRSDLLGTDDFKYRTLARDDIRGLPAVNFAPLPPELVFAPLDSDLKREYESFASIKNIMDRNGDPAPGIVTTQDQFAISFTREEEAAKVEALLATTTEGEARGLFRLCSQSQWKYSAAREALSSDAWRDELAPILYRPFDLRWTVYNPHVAVHRRERVSRHMLSGKNVALSIPRATEIERGWEHVFCADALTQHHTVSIKEVNYLFPLWLEAEWPGQHRKPNLSPSVVESICAATGFSLLDCPEALTGRGEDWGGTGDLEQSLGPRDIFDFAYAVLHSPAYRARYADFLKADFARIPTRLGGDLFRVLANLGHELVSLHLMESPGLEPLITEYTGPANPEVRRVAWSNNTVWLDTNSAKLGTSGFSGVPQGVWRFCIGGYQVCDKWLKDRKGRHLTDHEVIHYQKMVVAISETIRIMGEIDEVIEEHGGWPGAFASAKAEG